MDLITRVLLRVPIGQLSENPAQFCEQLSVAFAELATACAAPPRALHFIAPDAARIPGAEISVLGRVVRFIRQYHIQTDTYHGALEIEVAR